MNQASPAPALKRSNKGVEWVIILVAIGLIGLTGYLVYRLVIREGREDFTRPSLVTYDARKPRDIKVTYNKGQAVAADANTTNDTVTVEWNSDEDVRAFLYVTDAKEELISDIIKKTLTAATSNVSVTPTPATVDANGTTLRLAPVEDEAATGSRPGEDKVLEALPEYNGEWVDFDSNDNYTKTHKVTLSGELVYKYRQRLQINKEVPTDAPERPSTTDLYYYIIHIDRNGNSFPYGDEALTFNESGPTQGYVLPLAQQFNN